MLQRNMATECLVQKRQTACTLMSVDLKVMQAEPLSEMRASGPSHTSTKTETRTDTAAIQRSIACLECTSIWVCACVHVREVCCWYQTHARESLWPCLCISVIWVYAHSHSETVQCFFLISAMTANLSCHQGIIKIKSQQTKLRWVPEQGQQWAGWTLTLPTKGS